MSACLTPAEIVDLVDGTLDAERRAHVASCAACRQSVAVVEEALALAGLPDVPEPPAAFWPSINARVRAAIAVSEVTPAWRAWLHWDVVVPMAGLALLVTALASAVDGAARRTGDMASEAASGIAMRALEGGDAPLADDALALVEDLAAALPEGGWEALGVVRLPDLDVAAAALSDDEQAALAALLQSAVERPKS